MDLSNYQKTFTIKKGGSERADLVQQFLDRINPPRIAGGFAQITPARMGVMLAHIPTDELYGFYKMCDTYNGPFTKCFFGALKTKRM